MSENPYYAYLKYVSAVLGAPQVLTQTMDVNLRDSFFHPDEKLELGQKWDVIFVNSIFSSVESLFEESHLELFQKMLRAMCLENKSVLYVDSHLMNDKDILRRFYSYTLPEVMVIFKDHPDTGQGLRLIDNSAVIETYSPYHLQHHPEFKKITWNHLQTVMTHLGLERSGKSVNPSKN